MMTRGAGKTLLVTPYLGEFGWELMNWQGRVRRLATSGEFNRVVICAPADRRPLYADLGGDAGAIFCPVERMELAGEASEDHRVDHDGTSIAPEVLRDIAVSLAHRASCHLELDREGFDLFCPDFRSGLWSTHVDAQQFAEIRAASRVTTDIVLVPRVRRLAAERNSSSDWWAELAGRLEARGLIVETYQAPMCRAIVQLSRARLAVGASTGGLHLASLCRCPHFVWGSGSEIRWTRMQITNRQRYETVWNPLGTPCVYDECGWQPTLSYVEERVLRALDEIGLQRESVASTWSLRPTWRIKRRLSRLIEAVDGHTAWPWRLRQMVRERIV